MLVSREMIRNVLIISRKYRESGPWGRCLAGPGILMPNPKTEVNVLFLLAPSEEALYGYEGRTPI